MVKLLLRNFCWWCAPRSYQEIYSESKNSPISFALARNPSIFVPQSGISRQEEVKLLSIEMVKWALLQTVIPRRRSSQYSLAQFSPIEP